LLKDGGRSVLPVIELDGVVALDGDTAEYSQDVLLGICQRMGGYRKQAVGTRCRRTPVLLVNIQAIQTTNDAPK
jgi:hypothetical protein